MRADAARRRQSIITHARHTFAARGGDVALETVAAASGVGIATLYRNFATRELLVRAVIEDTVQQVLEAVAGAEAIAGQDPAAAWEQLLTSLMELELGALTDGLSLQVQPGSPELPSLADLQRPALEALDGLLRRLQRSKAVRKDISALDVVVSLATITRPQSGPIREAAPDVQAQMGAAYLLWSRTV
ncbi:TetR/AcrR family transcriptional regulator [Arthrobacter sp. NPDC055585]